MRAMVAENFEAMSRLAADLIVAELKRRPGILLCASAGSTPMGAYALLATRCARQPGLFAKLRVLQIDEWCGLERGHPATCESDLQTRLLGPLRIAPARFAGFRTDASDPGRECDRIARWLEEIGPIDVCVLGLGINGHVAMNEPAETFIPHAHGTRLTESSLRHPMLKNLARKPRYGMTLGLGDILRSRKILLLVSGPSKRGIFKRLAKPQVTTRLPASVLWLHPDVTILADKDAAAGLNASHEIHRQSHRH
jgi:galactosamine-6-phosphate isomerase